MSHCTVIVVKNKLDNSGPHEAIQKNIYKNFAAKYTNAMSTQHNYKTNFSHDVRYLLSLKFQLRQFRMIFKKYYLFIICENLRHLVIFLEILLLLTSLNPT